MALLIKRRWLSSLRVYCLHLMGTNGINKSYKKGMSSQVRWRQSKMSGPFQELEFEFESGQRTFNIFKVFVWNLFSRKNCQSFFEGMTGISLSFFKPAPFSHFISLAQEFYGLLSRIRDTTKTTLLEIFIDLKFSTWRRELKPSASEIFFW